MTLKQKLFGFEGRLRRRDYWLLNIVSVVVVYLVLIIVSLLTEGASESTGDPGLLMMLIVFVGVIGLGWTNLALSIKRCHDRNQSGFWILLSVIPLLGGIWTLVNLGILDGTPGVNNFGASPKARSVAEVFA